MSIPNFTAEASLQRPTAPMWPGRFNRPEEVNLVVPASCLGACNLVWNSDLLLCQYKETGGGPVGTPQRRRCVRIARGGYASCLSSCPGGPNVLPKDPSPW
jgi:hypothetical protein